MANTALAPWATSEPSSMVQRSRPPRHLPLEPIDPEGWDKDPGPGHQQPPANPAATRPHTRGQRHQVSAAHLSTTLLASESIATLPSSPTPRAFTQPDQCRSTKNRQGPAKDAPLLGRCKDQAGPLRGPCNSLRGEAQERCPTPFLPWRSARPPAAKSAPW